MDDTVLWDLGTFWPRATHPLAPPCYTERVIPELLRRVGHLAPQDDDIVVLSAQSQGSVIAAALVLQLSGADALVATCRRADRRGVRLALAEPVPPQRPDRRRGLLPLSDHGGRQRRRRLAAHGPRSQSEPR